MNYEILKREITDDEGCSNKVYLDHLGYPTVGIGHLIKKDEPEYGSKNLGKFVTKERITELFTNDADTAVKDCKNLFSNFDSIPEDIQHVLVNMMFNLGYTRFSKFKKFKVAIENRNWKQAAIEGQDSLWYNQVPNRARRLMERLKNGK